ncbi:MAG TPA: S8 family serine peptidase [Bryobacteraceae bacterium]|nr:S8 family serine peptidase [Bryobacteraceae bacterium]
MIRLGGAFLFCATFLAAEIIPGQYILELKAPAGMAAKPQAGAVRLAARSGQDDVRDEVMRRGGKVLASVGHIANAVIAEVPGTDAKALASIPEVQAVYPVRRYRMHLDRALDIHGVYQAWEAIGGAERAGLGMKIAILDTGIDVTHPGFQDDTLPVPDGYPKLGAESDRAFTSHKIIAARSYGDAASPQDGHGHGTAVAMVAAGVQHIALGGTLAGVAPRAYLGNYKVLDNSGTTTNATVLRAMDDAVADGMDVINLSLGESTAPRPADDPVDRAIDTASGGGVLVVVSAGNEGPDPNTIGSPGTAGSAITVGAFRTAAGSVTVQGLPEMQATLPNGAGSRDAITAPLADVAALDETGLACQPLPIGSLSGKIALILRGECTFEAKLNVVESAGAVAALLYSNQESPARPRGWFAGFATLPSMIVSFADGASIRERLSPNSEIRATLSFLGNTLSGFSSRGPGSDLGIKPDILALGSQILTAGQTTTPTGELYAPEGYLIASGTSFTAPLVSGAAAVLKAARPGLTSAQYRSLLINSATLFLTGDPRSRVQQAGAGMLNVAAALRNTVTVAPSSIALGVGGGGIDLYRDIQITNLGTGPEQFSFTIDTVNGPVPSVDRNTLLIAPGQSDKVTMELFATDLIGGEYQGFIEIRGEQSGSVARVPYWYAVPSNRATYLTLLYAPDTARTGSTAEFYFRITDPVGLAILGTNPQVTVVSGGGEVLEVSEIDAELPGGYRARVRMGPAAGVNTLEIRAAGLPPRTVQITGTAEATHP